jgi:hypothetical protein
MVELDEGTTTGTVVVMGIADVVVITGGGDPPSLDL